MIDVYWLEQTAADVPVDDEWLSLGEAVYLRGLRFPKRRHDWRLGRWTAKCAVALSTGAILEPDFLSQVEVQAAPSGAPRVFISGKPAGITISLSHRGERSACAVILSAAAVGCDLEIIEPRSAGFVMDFFTVEEQKLVANAAAEDRSRLVSLLWSAKESVLKALQVGLTLDTRCVDVLPDAVCTAVAGRGWRPLQARFTTGEIFNGWWQDTTAVVRTLVAEPPPNRPLVALAARPVDTLRSWDRNRVFAS